MPRRARTAFASRPAPLDPVELHAFLEDGATDIAGARVHASPPPAAPGLPEAVSVVVLGGVAAATAAALAAQTRPPEEVVDDAAAARHPIVAFTTAGARPGPDWLALLVAPLAEPRLEVVVGAVTRGNPRSDAILEGGRVDPGSVLPDPASMAIRRATLRAAHAGDPRDGAFGARLRQAGGAWGWVPDALVLDPVAPDEAVTRVEARAAEAAAAGRPVSALGLATALARAGGAGPGGILRVVRATRRGRARGLAAAPGRGAARLAGARGTALVLAGVPLDDVGGGSRSAQLAHELLRRGLHVTYVYLYPKHESVDTGVRITHAHLDQLACADFDPAWYARAMLGHGGADLALLEFPAAAFRPAYAAARAAGAVAVYDCIDRWDDPALGGAWYTRRAEAALAAGSDALVASAPDLVERLRGLVPAGRAVLLAPNAVNTHVFSGADPGPPPPDWPGGEAPVAGYAGSLYGDWFDWELLAGFAAGWPGPVVVIGDHRGAVRDLPRNVVFLGLKPWPALPAYLARFAVGLVPFAVSPVTHAVSPLKVYEYLACGTPVLATPLRALAGLPHVHMVEPGRWVAAGRDLLAAGARIPAGERAAIAAAESWTVRVSALLAHAGLPVFPDDAPGPTIRLLDTPAGARQVP